MESLSSILSRQPDYRIRRLALLDGEGPDAHVWIVQGLGWAVREHAWMAHGHGWAYASLSSPQLRAWIAGLPQGTSIGQDMDKTAPTQIPSQEPDPELRDFYHFCEAHGIHFYPLPTI